MTEGLSICWMQKRAHIHKSVKYFSMKPTNLYLRQLFCKFKISLAVTIKLARLDFPSKAAFDVTQKQLGTTTMPDILSIKFALKSIKNVGKIVQDKYGLMSN